MFFGKKKKTKKIHERSSNYRSQFFKHNKGVGGVYFCMYCGFPLLKKWVEVDHIKPIAKGGSNNISNLGPSCRKCNRSKSDKYNLKYAVKGHLGKNAGSALALPFAILGKIFSVFFSFSWKIQLAVVVLAIFWIRSVMA